MRLRQPPSPPSPTNTELDQLRVEINHLTAIVTQLSTMLTERFVDAESIDSLTKDAWRRSSPNAHLTWNVDMTGDEFVANARRTVGDNFGSLLEIGPGYGRLMQTMQSTGINFDRYVGVDISEETVTYLRERFGNDRISYEHVDLFAYNPPQQVDCIISSAVFMHLYPTIAPALQHCKTMLRPGGHLCFDVPAGKGRFLDIASRFYVRDYENPEEIKQFVEDAGYARCQVDPEPGFAPGLTGWFVCATA